MNTPPDPLDPPFEQWSAATPRIRQSMAAEVWRRIDEEESRSRRRGVLFSIELAFSRPAFAAAFVAVCLLGGLLLAEMRLSHASAERTARLERSYLRMLDPQLEHGDAIQPASLHR